VAETKNFPNIKKTIFTQCKTKKVLCSFIFKNSYKVSRGCPAYQKNWMDRIKSCQKVPGTFWQLFEKGGDYWIKLNRNKSKRERKREQTVFP